MDQISKEPCQTTRNVVFVKGNTVSDFTHGILCSTNVTKITNSWPCFGRANFILLLNNLTKPIVGSEVAHGETVGQTKRQAVSGPVDSFLLTCPLQIYFMLGI